MSKVRCPKCGDEHDLADLEPTFQWPDAFLEVPAKERETRVHGNDDACVIESTDDAGRRYFLRVLLPIPVHGESESLHWGLWVEMEEREFVRVTELWEDPEQGAAPAMEGTLANELSRYGFASTTGLPGQVQMTGLTTRPFFRLTDGLDHPLATSQREGVWPEQVLEWLVENLH